jgi:leucyl aminopeptidase (aminopeptidase T)
MRFRAALLSVFVALLVAVLAAPSLFAHDPASAKSARAAEAKRPASPGPAEIARRIVNDVLKVHPEEAIQVNTDLSNPALVDEVAVAISRAGGFPHIVYTSPRLTRRLLEETPEPYLAQTPDYAIKMLRVIDATINLVSPDSPTVLAQVPEHRLALVRKATEPLAERTQASPGRVVSLGNNGVPSKDLAQFHNAPLPALEDNFWRAVDASPAELRARGEKVRAVLSEARTLRLTAPNGTQLEMKLVGRPVILNTGDIPESRQVSEEHQLRQVWLPAGEAFTSPLETSANGILRVDSAEYRGIKVRDLRLMFSDGRVVDLTAEKGADALQEALLLSGGDKDRIAVIDVGLNPHSRLIPGSTYHSYEMEGVVTVGIGGISWAPTENRSDFAATFFLPNATLEADGRVIVKEGKLQI